MGNVATVVYIWTREVKAMWLYGCGEARHLAVMVGKEAFSTFSRTRRAGFKYRYYCSTVQKVGPGRTFCVWFFL